MGCIRRDMPAPRDKWHIDEVVIQINGKAHWLWRAKDVYGDVRISWPKGRTAKAAKRIFRPLVKEYDPPRALVTDKLRSCGVAVKSVRPRDHRAHKVLNSRMEI